MQLTTAIARLKRSSLTGVGKLLPVNSSPKPFRVICQTLMPTVISTYEAMTEKRP